MQRRALPTQAYELKPRGFFLKSGTVEIYTGNTLDVLRQLPSSKFQCVVTSPPYFNLRDYGTGSWQGGDPNCEHVGRVMRTGPAGSTKQASNAGANSVTSGSCRCGAIRVDQQIGLESTPQEYVDALVKVFREVRRVLRDDGVVFLNLGDSYAGSGKGGNPEDSPHRKQATNVGSLIQPIKLIRRRPGAGRADGIIDDRGQRNRDGTICPPDLKPKDLIGIPWRVAFALQDDGWWLRNDVIWHKPNPMPESTTDRCTSSHEYVFLLTKKSQYFWDQEAVKEKGVIPAGTLGAKGSVERAMQFGVNARPPEYMVYDGYRNIRDVWTINTEVYEGSHFATMPTKLVDICVRAGTSEHGCCSTCGAPWERDMQIVGKAPSGNARGHGATPIPDRMDLNVYQQMSNVKEQVGWIPTCECRINHPVPCNVLDPFGGSGTTGMVAGLLARHATIIDLKPDYVQMAQRRITEADIPVVLK